MLDSDLVILVEFVQGSFYLIKLKKILLVTSKAVGMGGSYVGM